MRYAAILIVLLFVVVVYWLFSRRHKRAGSPKTATASNVISMDRHRKAKQSSTEQLCSSCKKRNGKLIFYAQDNGSVVGLCKDCKTKAQRRICCRSKNIVVLAYSLCYYYFCCVEYGGPLRIMRESDGLSGRGMNTCTEGGSPK